LSVFLVFLTTAVALALVYAAFLADTVQFNTWLENKADYLAATIAASAFIAIGRCITVKVDGVTEKISGLKTEMAGLKTEMTGLRSEMKTEMNELKTEMRAGFARLLEKNKNHEVNTDFKIEALKENASVQFAATKTLTDAGLASFWSEERRGCLEAELFPPDFLPMMIK